MAGKRREGRGHLHTIDMLPEEASEHVQWAASELMARERTQEEIREEFNQKLATLDLPPVSRSSFNRYAVRQAVTSRALDQTRKVAAAVVETLGPDKADNVTILIVELIKTAAYDLLVGGKVSAKDLQSIARALDAAQRAQKVSNTNRTEQEERDEQERAAVAASDALVEADPRLNKEDILRVIREAYLKGGE